ncbi:DUF3987 domain-containing protein [Burkholderia arboris]|uniref:DUF3987 domain-containing protein n=1 Tax=Burkholderia arboris TaxID=488730 RepID=UPI001588B602|nr:DUF3987 domain-containing protein [Burkholderia arboris]
MHAPAYQVGGGHMPSPRGFLPPVQAGHRPLPIIQAIHALTPKLFRVASEQHAIYGSTDGAILTNLLGKTSFAAAANFRICGHNGKPMPLSLDIMFAGRSLSGKTDTHDRFMAPIVEAMKRSTKSWLFDNVTPATLLRKMRGGSVLVMITMPEGRGYLRRQLSRAFQENNELYDGYLPAFDRADDDDEGVVNTPDSVAVVWMVNSQSDATRIWLDKYGQEAIESGNLFRKLMLQTEETAVEGAGSQQPEVALLDYDHRMVELMAAGSIKLAKMSANQLPVIEITPEAEQLLRSGVDWPMQMARPFLSSNDARVFAVRLSANVRRIAGCMHVFEGYEGAVSADTMARAMTIAECFASHWLAMVFPPKSMSEAEQRGLRFLEWLYRQRDKNGEQILVHRKSDLDTLAPNFGWTRAQMTEAITLICGCGLAQIVTRIENGRRVINVELIKDPVAFQRPHWVAPPRLL